MKSPARLAFWALLLCLGGCASKTAKLMRVGRDAFHDALLLAQGGQWAPAGRALEMTRGHVSRALADRPVLRTRQGPLPLQVLVQSWEMGAWQPLAEAVAREDLPAFELAYANAARQCARCHESAGEKHIEVLPEGWRPPVESVSAPTAGAQQAVPEGDTAAVEPERTALRQDPLLPLVPRKAEVKTGGGEPRENAGPPREGKSGNAVPAVPPAAPAKTAAPAPVPVEPPLPPPAPTTP